MFLASRTGHSKCSSKDQTLAAKIQISNLTKFTKQRRRPITSKSIKMWSRSTTEYKWTTSNHALSLRSKLPRTFHTLTLDTKRIAHLHRTTTSKLKRYLINIFRLNWCSAAGQPSPPQLEKIRHHDNYKNKNKYVDTTVTNIPSIIMWINCGDPIKISKHKKKCFSTYTMYETKHLSLSGAIKERGSWGYEIYYSWGYDIYYSWGYDIYYTIVEDMKYTIVEDIWILIEVLQVLVLLDLRNYLLKSGAEGRACTDPGTTTMRLK